MRTLPRFGLAVAALAAGALLAPQLAAATEIGVAPVSWNFLLGACMKTGGDFGAVGHIYWCTVHNCDGKGGDCHVVCDDTDDIETCTGQTPLRSLTGLLDERKFLKTLGTRFLPAAQGDTGTPSHDSPAAAALAPTQPAGGSVIY